MTMIMGREDTRASAPVELVACEYAALVDALASVGVAAGSLPYRTDSHRVTLDARDGDLTVRASDTVVSVFARVPGAAPGTGRVTVNHGELVKLLAAVVKDVRKRDRDRLTVRITADDPLNPVLSVAGYEIPLTALPAESTLTSARLPYDPVVWVDRERFVTEMARVLRAVGTDDTLPMLTGVHVTIGYDAVQLAATDRFRLAIANLPATGRVIVESAGLLDGRSSRALIKRFTGERVGLAVATYTRGGFRPSTITALTVVCGDLTVLTELDESDFPRYESLLPEQTPGRITADRSALLSQVRRAGAIVDAKGAKGTPVRVVIDPGGIRVVPELPDAPTGMVAPSLPATITGIPAGSTVKFNPRFFTDALDSFTSDTVTLHWTTNHKPVVITETPASLGDRHAFRHLLGVMRTPGSDR